MTIDWMPGQTEFGCCIQGMIDGRRIAFTGDNLFANPDDPTQDGHEGVIAHNSAIFEEGYIYAAEYLHRLQPDLILGGHSYVMDHPKELIERYHRWAVSIRDLYKELSAEPDYRLMFDPFWVRRRSVHRSRRRRRDDSGNRLSPQFSRSARKLPPGDALPGGNPR